MKKIVFGVISDTHLCSTAENLSALHDFYRWISKYTNMIYHAGDFTDGMFVYKGQENNLKVHGVDNQIAYAVKNYPRIKGLETHVISGNHDLRTWEKTGVDAVKKVCEQRPDLIYEGKYRQKVKLPFGEMWTVHPAGGAFYSISYGAQKYVRGLHKRPRMIVFGHRHQLAQLCVEGVEVFEAGCFQNENDFTIRRGLTPETGGWLLEIGYTGRTINQIRPIEKRYEQT